MRNIILGTDWYSDCDDAVAIRVMARARKAGVINLMGISINAAMELSVQSLGGFLASENCNVPIGIDETAIINRHARYQPRLAKLPSKYTCNADAEKAVSLYRRLLADATAPVDIAEIGFMQVLEALLKSQPDEHSPLTGMELVESKVRKLWLMAGKWDEFLGKEYNSSGNKFARRSANYICKHWPTPITFLGWEVSYDILTGGNLDETDILGKVLLDYGCPHGKGRPSWDPMLVLLAIVGDEEKAGYRAVEGEAHVCRLTGRNYFRKVQGGKHHFVVKARPNEYYQTAINSIIEGDNTPLYALK